MEVFRDNGVVLTYYRAIKRFAFSEGNSFISTTIPTFKVLIKILGIKQDISIVMREDSSSVDLLVNSEGASLMFLDTKSKLHRSRILLTHEFIGKFLLREDSFFTICEERGTERDVEEEEEEDGAKPLPTYEILDESDRSMNLPTNFEFTSTGGFDVPEGPTLGFYKQMYSEM
jgi:hypothetical protein